ncbi:hypothetical protein BHU72_03130 [Desulfuribacillus stibiiarsenatis]|uniref:YlqD protein n=1 Tax=Desulfuribacillus stibiiarsenatis TaxID=1390249 RepID=A0A1E5L6L2_9FIRM|nr:YlqD family protein [Desulfuribacillus stibiiarsenatis]OEH85790.1 hypothetical protein BHU72_03130 [Desulfuribacillus stibiiarsenatis]
MLVKRSVRVKMIMTDETRKEIEEKYLGELHQIRIELEQLEFQNKKLVAEARRKSIDAKDIIYKFDQEKKKRALRLEQLEIKIKEILKIENGVELAYSTVDSYVTVEIGSKWETLIESPEIILKDGIVVEIRNP